MPASNSVHRQARSERCGTSTAVASPDLPVSLELELVKMLAQQGRRVPIPIFLAACLIAAMASDHLPQTMVAGWLALVSLVLLLRYQLLGRLQHSQAPLPMQLRMAVFLSAVSGISHGLSLVFFPFMPDLERAVQSIMLVGLCAGSVATTAGFLPAFLAYLIPTLLPLSILWLLTPSPAPSWLSLSVALLIALLAIILVALAKDAYQLLRQSFDNRQQQIVLNQRLQQALNSAESANRAKTRFLAAASHDLRQPLQSLSLFAASLTRRMLDPRSHQLVQYIHEAVQDLSSELDSLLDISKLDAAIVEPQYSVFSLSDLLTRLMTVYQPLATSKSLTLTLECPDDLYLFSDRQLLERVLRNLLDNAIKYTEQGSIQLSLQQEPEHLWLLVSDTGAGIAESEQAQIFEEFYQVQNPERDRQQGLGLGLAIVKRLVQLLKLELQLHSVIGQGSTFRLELPRTQHRLPAQSEPSSAPAFRTCRLLIVDDESRVRQGLQSLLEHLGHQVMLADSSQSAWQCSQQQRPDLVISDLRLRGEDSGLHCIERLRQQWPDLPALLISGDTAPERLRQAHQAGLRLLHKPVRADELTQAIAQALG